VTGQRLTVIEFGVGGKEEPRLAGLEISGQVITFAADRRNAGSGEYTHSRRYRTDEYR